MRSCCRAKSSSTDLAHRALQVPAALPTPQHSPFEACVRLVALISLQLVVCLNGGVCPQRTEPLNLQAIAAGELPKARFGGVQLGSKSDEWQSSEMSLMAVSIFLSVIHTCLLHCRSQGWKDSQGRNEAVDPESPALTPEL